MKIRDRVQLAGRIENRAIRECSGMDASPHQNNLVWVINDGGNGPQVFAMGTDGRDRGRIEVTGAVNRDWEAIDAFEMAGKSYLLIADVGDNQRVRQQVTLYVIEEPMVDGEKITPGQKATLAWQITFRYPDRAHDAEAVAVDPVSQRVIIVTKRDQPPRVYRLPLIPRNYSGMITAEYRGNIETIPSPTADDLTYRYGRYRSHPTAMDISADGRRLVLLTYKHAYRFDRQITESWARVLSRPGRLLRLPLPQHTPLLHQREAICFSRGGSEALVTSEGVGAEIYRISF